MTVLGLYSALLFECLSLLEAMMMMMMMMIMTVMMMMMMVVRMMVRMMVMRRMVMTRASSVELQEPHALLVAEQLDPLGSLDMPQPGLEDLHGPCV